LKGLSVKPTTHTVWVDNASGLPVKQETLNAEGLKIVQLITYDASIQITLPDEAKNAKVVK
jgi:negative regulator of sigma E activity